MKIIYYFWLFIAIMFKVLFVLISFCLTYSCTAQVDSTDKKFSRQDSLRGALNAWRTCYDVTAYDLNIKVDFKTRSVAGYNTFTFRVNSDFATCQIDLFQNMKIDKILYHGRPINHTREGNAVFLKFLTPVPANTVDSFTVYYHGSPRPAPNAPWDGGFVWRKDKNKMDWLGVACEGLGASCWWPLKDHLSDEPDRQRITVEVPAHLTCISNGRLTSTEDLGATKKYSWFVNSPINSYNVTLNIGQYTHIQDSYKGLEGKIDLDYYVLKGNESQAGKHFEQVKTMLKVFENKFGPYPFREDGYKLVETDYWGMEHQSCIAYGNKFQNNEWGFDYIIVHESGHEWFGNSLSVKDHAEMWIHESFTTYTEFVFVEETMGYSNAVDYLKAQRFSILNKDPILGPLDVNFDGWRGSDMYYKGSWMLHTLRNCVANDSLWWKTLRKLCTQYKMNMISTPDVVNFFNRELKNDYSKFFKQYLEYPTPPYFEYKIVAKGDEYELEYRWKCNVEGFNMPVDVYIGAEKVRLKPETQSKKMMIKESQISVDKNSFYVFTRSL